MAEDFICRGKIFMVWMTTIPAIFLFNKDHIQKILSKNDEELLNKGVFLYKGVNDIVPNSLLTVPGDKWKIRRKVLSTPFHTTNLNNLVNVLNFESKNLVQHLKTHPCEDLIHEMQKITIQVFCKILFEYDLVEFKELDDVVALSRNVTDILTRKAFSIFIISPFLYRFTTLATEETAVLKRLMDFKNRMLKEKIDSSKESLKSKLHTKNLDEKASTLTLIEILLKNFKNTMNEKTKVWSGFEMEEIRAQLDTFIIAGFDTVSTAMTFLFYNLAKYSDYQEKVYEELISVCGNDPDHEITLEEVRKCVQLDAFINESLRIQPVVPLVSRCPAKDLKLDDNYTIFAGTDVVIFIEGMLKDPDYWSEPNTFRPERFLEDKEGKENIHSFIPFSFGPRDCVAKKAALNVLTFVTANLLRNFKVQFTNNTPREMTTKFELVNKPRDRIELKFVQRN